MQEEYPSQMEKETPLKLHLEVLFAACRGVQVPFQHEIYDPPEWWKGGVVVVAVVVDGIPDEIPGGFLSRVRHMDLYAVPWKDILQGSQQ